MGRYLDWMEDHFLTTLYAAMLGGVLAICGTEWGTPFNIAAYVAGGILLAPLLLGAFGDA